MTERIGIESWQALLEKIDAMAEKVQNVRAAVEEAVEGDVRTDTNVMFIPSIPIAYDRDLFTDKKN
jgi:hypothetical protein